MPKNLPPRGWGYRAVPPEAAKPKQEPPKPPKPSKGGATTAN